MMQRKMALFGGYAFLGFVISFLGFAYLTPDYSHTVNQISELGIEGAPYAPGWNLIGFGLVGVLVLPLAWSMLMSLRPASGAGVISALVAVSGIGWTSLGVFAASPGFQPSLSTTLHFMAVTVNYLPFLIAAFVFTFKMKNKPYWKSWALFSLIMGLLGVASFFIPATILPGPVSQRLALMAYFSWLLVMGWAVYRKPLQS